MGDDDMRPPPDFMDSPVFGDELPDDAIPPPGTQVTVVRSLRLPVLLDLRVKAAATERGVPVSTLVREWIELGLTALEQDELISRADALRAIAGLRPTTTAVPPAPAERTQRSS